MLADGRIVVTLQPIIQSRGTAVRYRDQRVTRQKSHGILVPGTIIVVMTSSNCFAPKPQRDRRHQSQEAKEQKF
jgi:hypothetical protein